MTFDERYDAKVDRSGGPDVCWPWTAGTTKDGYGMIRFGDEAMYAHRIALERRLGRPIKPRFCSLHHCDNPPCCNPAHLFEGTKGDNNRDKAEKGGAPHGEGHWRCKVTETDVQEIRCRAREGETQRFLAAEFDMSQSNVSLIVRRERWGHVA